jgi:DNA helicase HerA-like ATPase
LAPIPDLTLSKDDPDLFKFQKSSARASLMDILKVRSTDTRVEAILSWALDKLAASNDRRLTILSEILLDLPNYENGEEIFDGANAMAEKLGAKLKAAIITDENLKKDNHTDISSLFKPKRKKARISVIYAKELGSTTEQEIFIGNLIMEIFSWLSRNPGPGGLAGLLVIDEAKDLAPSRESTSAKAPIVRYASQARKYGYGLIIASQMFKSIDHNIVGNCDSLFVGRQGSGSAATAAEEMLGIKNKIANLEPTNYAVKVNSVVPNKVNWMKSAMCLSHHPSKAPDRDKILEMAYKSREFV